MTTPSHLVALLGRGVIDEPAGAVLPAFDLGLTRGDGCFDATRLEVSGSGEVRVDHLAAHLDRLDRSAAALGIEPVARAEWCRLVDDALAHWNRPGEAVLRLMLTRGSELGDGPSGVLTIAPVPAATVDQRHGISVATLSLGRPALVDRDATWLLGGVKTLSYAVNMAAAREAARRGADDALFVSSDGIALEGPRSALIWRVGGALCTTPVAATGILASVTQSAVFAAAVAEGREVRHELLAIDELAATDGAWLVSSGRLVAPILRLDDRVLDHDPAWTARLTAWATTPMT